MHPYSISLLLPKLVVDGIYQYNNVAALQQTFKSLKRKFKFKRLASTLFNAIKFRNLQSLADFLAIRVSQGEHIKYFYKIRKYLAILELSGFSGSLLSYRIGLYGRIKNVARTTSLCFFAQQSRFKPTRSTFNSTIHFAETTSIASIGVFNIKI